MSGGICRFCGENYSLQDLTYLDTTSEGFFCDYCDGFTYTDKEKNEVQKFNLILEESSPARSKSVKTTRKFNKRLSPLRYPGGKSKITDILYQKIQVNRSNKLVGVFAGGASFELSMLEAGVVDRVILNDLDYGIYSLFRIICENPEALINKIQHTELNHSNFFTARDTILDNYSNKTPLEAAWALLIANRLSYSGITKANPLGGRKGTITQLLSRWNKVELCKRIKKIHSMAERIEVTQIDALELIEEEYWNEATTLFIDPPYVKKGSQLYKCFYQERDHISLLGLLDSLYQGVPGADILVTYDNHPLISKYACHPKVEVLNRVFSC
ncbi:DNA adenine methylase (plasmid) [Bacillus safensis subsp. safensis]|uniref:DNA adenine methylase n=1 Tax=Bacillus safensis TaxID=561879 RepID=UPI0037BFC28B